MNLQSNKSNRYIHIRSSKRKTNINLKDRESINAEVFVPVNRRKNFQYRKWEEGFCFTSLAILKLGSIWAPELDRVSK